MIERPPRSAVELSPGLRSIAEQASVRFDEPDDRMADWPVIRLATFVRFAVVAGLVLAALASRVVLDHWRNQAETPSAHAVVSAQYLEQARQCEQMALELRAGAATGKPWTPKSGGASFTPVQAQASAMLMDQQAANLRKMAEQETRRELGLPEP